MRWTWIAALHVCSLCVAAGGVSHATERPSRHERRVEAAPGDQIAGDRRSIARLRRSGDAQGEARACFDLEYQLYELGRLDEGAQEVSHAIAAAQASSDSLTRAWGWLLEARHLAYLDRDLSRSLHLFHSALSAAPPRGAEDLRLECLSGLARTSLELGKLEEAHDAYLGTSTLASRLGDGGREAWARLGLARVAVEEMSELPDHAGRQAAKELALQARDAAQAANDPSDEATASWMLGMLSDGKEAHAHLARCLDVAPGAREKSACLNALARLLAKEDHPAAAQRTIKRAVALAGQMKDHTFLAAAWGEQMKLSWAIGSPTAFEDSMKALAKIEEFRNLQPEPDSQADLFSTWTDDYCWLAGRLLERGDPDDLNRAFSVIERMRARGLLDAAQPTGHRPPHFATLAEVRGSLPADEALLSFQIAPKIDWTGDFGGGSWLLVITRTSTRVYPLIDRLVARPSVKLFVGELSARDGAEAEAGARLYQQLLAPALGDLPSEVDRLVIVPDDEALYRLPFAALRRSARSAPLAGRFQISLTPSATLWLHWHGSPPSGATLPALALAPSWDGARGDGDRSAERSAAGLDALDLPPLPRSLDEGESVVDALGGGSILRAGEEASLDFLDEVDLRRFAVLHFATHAVVDEKDPQRSAIVLSPASSADRGRLSAAAIDRLRLNGQLVVLSSCRSAGGTVLRGEGAMSLASAFFRAGARTVVASLWPVRDDEAAAFFKPFYAQLARGDSVAAALTAAQRDRLAAGAPAAAWAGFVVLGDGGLAPLPSGRKARMPVRAMGISAALAGIAYLVSRRRPRSYR